MSDMRADHTIRPEDKVRVPARPEWGVGEVLKVAHDMGTSNAKVLFQTPHGERVENVPLDWLERSADLWERLTHGEYDSPADYLLKQAAINMAYSNTGGELSSSKVNLLPHQILLVHELVGQSPRRKLIADEVGLGKTIETGMLIRELVARGEAKRVLIVVPAGLLDNWQRELREAFRLHFDILGRDFQDHGSATWERYTKVIASIDALKQARRLQRLRSAPVWDLVIFDEAHHLSRTRTGSKTVTTQNYKLAEALKNHTSDLLFLSATPHQGNAFQFWSLIQLLDDQLFADPEAVARHRGLLNRVMIRRTKREVTDAEGNPIFRRRQVHTERFSLGPRERNFYERLSEYLSEGYNAAGMGQGVTTSRQRAIGFVMATFQKIMSSSPRAIQQALRRRLLVLFIREQLALDTVRRSGRGDSGSMARRILDLDDEMLRLAKQILGAPAGAEAEAYVARVRRRVQKRDEQAEITGWTMDGDEEGAEGIYAEVDIPGEKDRVRDLLRIVPPEPDRRFETLLRAVSDLSRTNPEERFVIFTQYRDTLDFIAEELGKVFGAKKIAVLQGGPLDDKIAAMEAFWHEDGARFLISTSAGGEGINLQIGRVLFNYDLPWNPMAVEQRIGRVHRYGQHETVQVYNLFAEDTVEDRIYALLEGKLFEIAEAIGKTDDRGQPREDFRSEILGLLGSRPDYQDLFKRALVERDYARTEEDIVQMLREANRAREALDELSQDLTSFNLEHYRTIDGRHSLAGLGRWLSEMLLRCGGFAVPNGEFWTLHVPESLQRKYHLPPRFEKICFDRALALRIRGSELGGIGHPLVDALLHEGQEAWLSGAVAWIGGEQIINARYLVQYEGGDGRKVSRVITIRAGGDGSVSLSDYLPQEPGASPSKPKALRPEYVAEAKQRIEEKKAEVIMDWLPGRAQRGRVKAELIGVHLL